MGRCVLLQGVVSVLLQGGHGCPEGNGGGLAQKPNHITRMKGIYCKAGHTVETGPKQTTRISQAGPLPASWEELQ